MATERMVIWRGISELDGVTPIVLLATGVPIKGKGKRSANTKTGDMIQTWILRDDVAPHEALKQGLDEAICGTCPLRGKASGGSGACYVNVGQGPRSTWVAHQAKGSAEFDVSRFAGQKVRFGAYGDPAAVPFHIWEAIGEVAEAVTGYTHQWKTSDVRFAKYCMASAGSMPEYLEARRLGYRAFLVIPHGADKPKGFVTCPASEEAGKRTVCADCLQCGGTSNGRKANISIQAHGTAKNLFAVAS